MGLGVAAFLGSWVLKQDPGNEKMQEISQATQEGAMAFLKAEWRVLIIFAIGVFVALAFSGAGDITKGALTGLAFLTGGFLSAAAGYVGMYVATRANTRTAQAATTGIAKALNVAFRSGLTMGLTVASFGVFGLSLWIIFLIINGDQPQPEIVNGFALGASSIALFARVGGGIYTKAADVGADLVGKVEAGIPEDDPRNPAVIADNVGDNVGDVAGMGADLFESYVGSILAPIVLGARAVGRHHASEAHRPQGPRRRQPCCRRSSRSAPKDLTFGMVTAAAHRRRWHHRLDHRSVRGSRQGGRQPPHGAQRRHLRRRDPRGGRDGGPVLLVGQSWAT